MSRRRLKGALALIGTLVAVQAGLFVAYRIADDRRDRRGQSSDFSAEILDGRQAAPEFELVRADGSRLRLEELAGRPVLVHFWATWCPPCRDELPGLVDAAGRFRDRGLVLVAVTVDDSWASVNRFFAGRVPGEIFRSASPDAHHRYGVFALPDTYLVSADGRLVRRYGGARDWRSAAAGRHLAEVVRSAGILPVAPAD